MFPELTATKSETTIRTEIVFCFWMPWHGELASRFAYRWTASHFNNPEGFERHKDTMSIARAHDHSSAGPVHWYVV